MFCSKCGMNLPEGSAFCPGCGNKVAQAPVVPVAPVAPVEPVAPVVPVAPVAPVEPVAPVVPVAPVAPVAPVEPVAPVAAPVEYAAPVAPAAYAAPVAAPKKKSMAWLYILIGVLVVAIAAGVLYFTGVFGDNDKDDDDDKDDKPGTSQSVPADPNGSDLIGGPVGSNQTSAIQTGAIEVYPTSQPTTQPSQPVADAKVIWGYFEDGYYINEWAGVMLKIPSDWVDVGSRQTSSYNVDIGLNMQSNDVSVQLTIQNRLGDNVSPEQYIELMIDTLTYQYSSYGITAEFDEVDLYEVADIEGYGSVARLTKPDGTYMYEGIFAYLVDDYIVLINATATTDDMMADIMNSFEAV